MVTIKKTFLILLGFCNVIAFENLSLKFLDFKGLNRGIIASCNLDHNVFKHSSSYFISYYNLEKESEKLKNFGSNIKKVSAVVGITYNLDCNNAKEFIRNISSFVLFNNKNWLFITGNLTATKNILMHLDIHLNSDVSIAAVEPSNSHKLYEAYKIEDNILVFNEIEGGLMPNGTFTRLSKIMRRRNFHGINLKGAITLPTVNNSCKAMVSYLESKVNVYADTMQRKNYKIALNLGEMFNFSIKLVKSNEWGTYQNNRWSGVIGMMDERKANFSISTVRISKPRYEAADYIPPSHTVLLAFVFRHPRSVTLRNVFQEPFTDIVWMLVFSMLLIFTLTFRCIAPLEDKSSLEPSTSNVAVLTFGMIFQQGTSNTFKLYSSRILFASILLLSFMLEQFYSAFLVGSLLSEPPKTIDTPEKLYNSHLRLGMEKLSYNEELMTITSNISRKVLTNRILLEKQKNVLTFNEGLEQIKKGGFAFHVDTFGAYRYLADTMTDKRFCQLKSVKMIPTIISSIILQKNSSIKEYFMYGVLRITEHGVLDYQDKFWRPKIPNCEMIGSTIDDIEVGLEPILSAFLILGSTMLFSILLLLLECSISKDIWRNGYQKFRKTN